MAINLIKSKVIKNTALNDKFHSFLLKVDDPFLFEPGQFVTLKVNNTTFRSYSIFSHPNDLPNWEMFVDITPGGPGTTYLKSLKAGDFVETTKPIGSFVFQNNAEEKNVIMAATGCGFAPLRPMIEEALNRKNIKIKFLWGLRKNSEISCLNLFNKWSKNSNFKYEIILSQPDKDWTGKVGHITDYLPKLDKKDFSNSEIYLAGNGNFVKESIDILVKVKFPEEKIYFEQCYFTV